MNRSIWQYVDDPGVDLTPRGRSAVVWVDQRRKDVFLRMVDADRSGGFEHPVNVSRSSTVFSWFPDVVVNHHKQPPHVYVLWQEIVFSGGSHGGEIFFARSVDGGRSFQEPINLSQSKAGDGKGRLNRERWDNGSLDLTIGPGGGLYAAWTEYEGRLWFSYSHNSGDSFSEPVLVSGRGGRKPARGPSLAVGSSNRVYLVWTVGGTDEADVHVTRLTPRGRTAAVASVIHPNARYSDAPKIAVSETGTVHVAWSESSGGREGVYQLRYTRKPRGDTQFEEPRKLSPDSSETYGSYNFPSLRLDAEGNPYVLWELYPEANRNVSYGLGFIRSSNRGRSFGTLGVVPGTVGRSGGYNGSLQGKLSEKFDVEGDGDLAVVNSTFNPGRFSYIRLYRGAVSR